MSETRVKEAVDFGALHNGKHHIELASGHYLDLSDPNPEAITLDDVAQGLSHTCRFAGQSRRFYSVAEHALLVADKLKADRAPIELQLAGLHHDDTEAFLGDITRPLKALLPGYREMETAMWAAIATALDLDLPMDDPAIKAADNWALSAEAYHLLPSKGRTWFCDGLYDAAQLEWTPPLIAPPARERWLRRHHALQLDPS